LPVRLRLRIQRRPGADVCHVDFPRQQRLDQRRAGIEYLCLQLSRRSRLGEVPGRNTEHRLGMCQIREVADTDLLDRTVFLTLT